MKEINLFVSFFVPGFELYVDSISHSVSKTRKEEQKIAIYRKMGNRRLPLGEECAGIRKLLSIAVDFISVYGDSSSWLAVDELDSGVFENLLGQLLQVLEQNGKGQLIFTAHNLAPLRTYLPFFHRLYDFEPPESLHQILGDQENQQPARFIYPCLKTRRTKRRINKLRGFRRLGFRVMARVSKLFQSDNELKITRVSLGQWSWILAIRLVRELVLLPFCRLVLFRLRVPGSLLPGRYPPGFLRAQQVCWLGILVTSCQIRHR